MPIAVAPRPLIRASVWHASLLLLLPLPLAAGCVSQSQYDQAQALARVEQAAHRKAVSRVQALQLKINDLTARLAEREKSLWDRKDQLAESQFDAELLVKQRDAAGEIVQQLRGELARVGDHLRAFSTQKEELTEALKEAEQRAQRLSQVEHDAARLAVVTRDVSLLQSDALESGELDLTIVPGKLSLSGDRAALAQQGGQQLSPKGRALLSSLSELGELHPDIHYVISVPPSGADTGEALAQTMRAALLKGGVAEQRLSVTESSGTDAAAEPQSAARLTIDVELGDPSPE